MKRTHLLAAFAMVATIGAAGCSDREPALREQPAATESASAAAGRAEREVPSAKAPAPAATRFVDVPPECAAYTALINRLATCDKASGARDGLIQSYEDLHSTWMAASADQRAAVNAQCKIQADSVRNATAAACGW